MKTKSRQVGSTITAIFMAVIVTVGGCESPPDDQRIAADWVFSVGGKVGVNYNGWQSLASDAGDLPSGPFVIESIAWDIYPGDENARVSDSDLSRLAKLSDLRDLDLWATRVTDQGIDALLTLTNLRRLQLSQTQVTDVGLAKLEGLPKLVELGLVGTRVTPAGIRRFQRSRPDCKVVYEASPRGKK